MDNVATSVSNSASFALASKVKDYFQLIKFTLSFTVVFSCVVCYLLSPNVQFNLQSVLLLFIAGMLITGSANAINQIEEKDTDALMRRTASRPVTAGRMQPRCRCTSLCRIARPAGRLSVPFLQGRAFRAVA